MSLENENQSEFDAAFAEAVGQMDSPAQATPSEFDPEDDGTLNPPPVEGDGAADPAKDNPDPAEAEDKPTEDKSDDKPAEPAKAEAPKTVEQLQAELDDLRHKERSASGRIGAFQKRINELEEKVTKSRDEFIKSLSSGDNEKFKKDFPEIAAAIDSRMAAFAQHVEKETMARLEPLKIEVYDRLKQEQDAAVEAAHPGWKKEVATPQFAQWLSNQPPQVQSLAESDTAADAAALLNIYKAMTRTSPPPVDATPPVTPSSQPSQANALQEARRQQLQNSVGISSRSAAQKTNGIPNEFDAAFNAFIQADPRFRN